MLLVVAVALFVLSLRALRIRDVLILAPPACLSVKGMRPIALFAVFCAVILPASAALTATMAAIAYGAATDRIYRYDALARRTGFGVSDSYKFEFPPERSVELRIGLKGDALTVRQKTG